MPGIYNQHNPKIAVNAPFVRVIHLRNSKGSLTLNDIVDNVYNNRQPYQVQAYVPFGETVDILMTDRVLTSYHQGQIRNLVNKGFAAAFILQNRDVVQAQIGSTYNVGAGDDLILVNTSGGAGFVTLPTAEDVTEGFTVEVKKTTTDANQVQISTTDGGDIEGAGPLLVFDGSQEAVTLKIDENGDWWVLTKSTAVGGGPGPGGPVEEESGTDLLGTGKVFAFSTSEWSGKAHLKGRSLISPTGTEVSPGGGGTGPLEKESFTDLAGTGSLFARSTAEWAGKANLRAYGSLRGAGDQKRLARRDYLFAQDVAVPKNGGILYLKADEIVTSNVPVVINQASTLTGAAIKVNSADATQSFDLEVLLNGVVVETLTLPAAATEASTRSFTTAVAQDDDISLRLNRATGTNKSNFDEFRVTLELREEA